MRGHYSNKLVWLVGAALLAAVITFALHLAEQQEFARLLEQAHPRWLLLALALQGSTYWAQAEVWRTVTRARGYPLTLGTAYRLSIAKLFMDQAIPTGGVSGTILYVQGLRGAGLDEGAALAGVVVATFSYYASYVLCLAAALVLAAGSTHLSGPVAAMAVAFLIVSTAFAITVLLQSGRASGPIAARLERIPILRKALWHLHGADPKLAHNPHVLMQAIAWQIGIVLCDAATIWVLLHAVGAAVAPTVVFASYLFSSLLRTASFVPGGLGAFEGASVFILHATGVPIAAALAATLLFRGLSFWLPMLPGVWFARRVAQTNRTTSSGF